MYVSSIEPGGRFSWPRGKEIPDSISWEEWLERWEEAKDLPAYRGLIHSAKVTPTIPGKKDTLDVAGARLQFENERWKRFLLEIADDFNPGRNVSYDTRLTIATAALAEVVRHLPERSMDFDNYSSEFIECLMWFLGPNEEGRWKNSNIILNLRGDLEKAVEKLYEVLAVHVWSSRPNTSDRFKTDACCQVKVITMLGAVAGKVDVLTGLLRDRLWKIEPECLPLLRKLAMRDLRREEYQSLRHALQDGSKEAHVYVSACAASGHEIEWD